MNKSAIVLLSTLALSAGAQSPRTLLVREAEMTKPNRWETGVATRYQEVDSDLTQLKTWDFTPYARYGLLERVSLDAAAALRNAKTDGGGSEFGLGDFSLGVDFKMLMDVFGYPYLMPYARLILPTGDDDKGLGAGSVGGILGLSAGTTVNDDWHIVADISTTTYSDDDIEDVLKVGGALIYDFTKQNSLIAEAQYVQDDNCYGKDGEALLYMGGIIYRPNRRLSITLQGGASALDDSGLLGGAKVAYNF